MLSIRNVTLTKCNLHEMLPIQSVLYENEPIRKIAIQSLLYENEPIRNVTYTKCTI